MLLPSHRRRKISRNSWDFLGGTEHVSCLAIFNHSVGLEQFLLAHLAKEIEGVSVPRIRFLKARLTCSWQQVANDVRNHVEESPMRKFILLSCNSVGQFVDIRKGET